MVTPREASQALALRSKIVLGCAALAALMAEHGMDDDAARPPRTPGPLPRPQPVLAPRRVTIRQGEDVRRPSLLLVDIPAQGGIDVTGAATRL